MTGTQAERRLEVRATFRTTAKLCFADGRCFDDCETMNVSVSGVFVRGIKGVVFGENCQVELHLSGRTSRLVLEMAGEIVRVEEDGVALQFLEVDEDSFYHLRNIVYFSFTHSSGAEEVSVEVDDETLYDGLELNRKMKPLPDDFFNGINGNDSDDFDDDSDDTILDHVRNRQDDDEY
jgi:hypothetical protein